jgi:hypothetical protein
MQDTAIKPLEDIAAAYADVRDQRMALNKDEHDLKQAALKLMKKYGKVIYRHEGIEIRWCPAKRTSRSRSGSPARRSRTTRSTTSRSPRPRTSTVR